MQSDELQNGTSRNGKARVNFELIREGLEEAVREAVAAHHRAGYPVVIWSNGRIVLLHPDGREEPVDAVEQNGTAE